ncbi:ATP-binding protein [Yinghuangia soli]|uniref:ATP-binding protein n=1 Tax=Yinghuangia soli TaxID=2908204 RepID=A0AA41Q9C8_9ACTN|nr:ATP-binding protein [Yinghuangia soli]MCF2533636.1 ATP-binding protein [Yinghuangia soli]
MGLPTINFREIRGHGPVGSQADGFEELVCQLMPWLLGEPPQGTLVERFGNPDGGREGRWVLPSGDVWSWQAKYHFGLDDGEISQITRSITTALDRETRLTRMLVVLPYDRPAGDRSGVKSAHTKWSEAVKRWGAAAAGRGMQVSFEYVGLHELMTALGAPENLGRVRYWFDRTVLSADWCRLRVSQAITDAGPRYTPELHVELPAAQALEGLGRTVPFADRLRELLAAVRAAAHRRYWPSPRGHEDQFDPLIERVLAALGDLDRELVEAIRVAQTVEPWADWAASNSAAREALKVLSATLYKVCGRHEDGRTYYYDDAASLYSCFESASDAVEAANQARVGEAVSAAGTRLLLLTGEPGTGKSHLLCDAAVQRCSAGLPTLLFLGQGFDHRRLSEQIPAQVEFDGSCEHLLATLDAAGEAAGSPALLIIDALNEADDPGLWEKSLAGFVEQCLGYRHIVVALSCRSPFDRDLVPEGVRARATRLVHDGFAETREVALKRYLDAHGIERPSFPLLDIEYENPLFLKLLCSTLQARGLSRFPREGVSLTWLYDAHLASVNKRLARAEVCDYDPAERLVQQVVASLAESVLTGGGRMDYADVKAICEALLPGRPWSTSLFAGLLREGVLTRNTMGSRNTVVFGYQRLGEVAAAEHLTNLPTDDLRRVLEGVTRTAGLGLMQALAVSIPTKHQLEITDIIGEESNRWSFAASRLLIESLPWRSPASVTDQTVRLLLDELKDDEPERAWTTLVRLATVPGHPLNAELLHRHLNAMSLAARDSTWTQYVNTGPEAVDAVVSWAWSSASAGADDEVRALVATLLGWCLASTRRALRDRATKALVNLLDGHAATATRTAHNFSRVNDPYIVERIAAALCGAALRDNSGVCRASIAQALFEGSYHHPWPKHVLTRDYLRRSFEAGIASGWQVPDGLDQVLTPPYATPDLPDTAADSRLTEAGYESLERSLGRWGDFRDKVVASHLRYFAGLDRNEEIERVIAYIFRRVCELGWTPAPFALLDRGHNNHPGREAESERIGKKYQWIGLYEALGTLADHNEVRSADNWAESVAYVDPRSLALRDIDPTLTLQTLHRTPRKAPATPWFAPATPGFPSDDPDRWLAACDSLPNPIDLIRVADSSGGLWYALHGEYTWDEPLTADEAALDPPIRSAWMQIRSYLLPSTQRDAVASWAAKQHWMGRWMPEAGEARGLLLADHPHHPSWADLADEPGHGGPPAPCPATLSSTTAWYMGSHDRDRSTSEQVQGLVPSAALARATDLQRLDDMRWTRGSGRVDVLNPLIAEAGPDCLLYRSELAGALAAQGLTMLWTVLGEKQRMGSETWDMRRQDDYHWVEFSASYFLGPEGPSLNHTHAIRKRARDHADFALDWGL